MKLYAKKSQRIEVGSKRSAIGHIDDSLLVNSNKRFMIDKNISVRVLSTAVDTHTIPHSGLFSSDRRSSKAFLLILSDKKCQFQWLRIGTGEDITPTVKKQLKEKEEAPSRAPKKYIIVPPASSKTPFYNHREEVRAGPPVEKTMTEKWEKSTVHHVIDSPQLWEVNSIQSYTSSDQIVGNRTIVVTTTTTTATTINCHEKYCGLLENCNRRYHNYHDEYQYQNILLKQQYYGEYCNNH